MLLAKNRTLLPAMLTTLLVLSGVAVMAADHVGEKIRVLNEQGQPIAGADVLIGNDAGKPFANNTLKTDVGGTVTITKDWQGPQPVTISANGYLRTTFLNVEPEAHDFQLHVVDATNQIEIKGQTTGFGDIARDGKVQFGLVYPAVTRQQLATFDLNAVLSPQFDEIKVLTQTVSIPSNLTLPDQEQSYILPIELNKPDYRVYVRDAGTYRVTATHGQFPLKQVVNALRGGKQFYEILDLFKFSEYGQRDVTVTDKIDDQDIPVNQVQVANTINAKGPTLADNQVMISAAMVQQGDVYFMSDIKRVNSGDTVALGVPSSQNTSIVSVVMPGKEAEKIGGLQTVDTTSLAIAEQMQNPTLAYKLVFDRFINIFGNILPADEKTTPNDGPGGLSVALHQAETQPMFLSLVSRPVYSDSAKTVSITPPAAVSGVTPLATYVVLSQIDHINEGRYNIERRTRMWEFYDSGWTSQIQMPNLSLSLAPGKNYRWEVYYMGSTAAVLRTNAYFLDKATHVTHNSFDL